MKKKYILTTLVITILPILLLLAYMVYSNSEAVLSKTSGIIDNHIGTAIEIETDKNQIVDYPRVEMDENPEQFILNPEKIRDKINFVPYNGRVEHLFFHPLIAYPEQAFDGDWQSNGFDDWFVTVNEFKKIIQSLYDKNFILVDINSLYEEVSENGTTVMKRKEILVPEGRKPIIISVDDLNYNRYMLGNGTNYKLVIGADGNIAAYSKNSAGEDVISYDSEIVPILDRFVAEHPDFSLKGAKGVLAITGYEGILGYRTDRNSPNKESEIEEALKVAKRLKETGWSFASHSYGHPDITKISYNKLIDDSTKWRNEVEALLGATQVYIYPHGVGPRPNENKFKYLQSMGFKIFCHVGAESLENILPNTNAVLMDRRHADGVSLRYQRDSFLDLYDANEIMEKYVRPKR